MQEFIALYGKEGKSMAKILLKVSHVCKTFGETKALDDVDLIVSEGEIHGLIGENGSGKSTLSSIIAGTQNADKGQMVFKGQSYAPETSIEANANGISMLLQEQGTFDNMSVAANIFIGREKEFEKNGLIQMDQMYKKAREALDRIGATEINEKARVAAFSFEEKKLIEIARAMDNHPDILIVDETTTALSKEGRELLYKLLRERKKEGRSAIFISHDIAEVREVCDYLTVLRDGIRIDTLDKASFSDDKIRQLMVGREVNENFYRTDNISSALDEVAVRFENVSYGILKNINFELHKGEILGFGGLTDCGMHDIGKLAFGRFQAQKGRVVLGNGTQINSTITAVKNGIGYVAKDRDKESLMSAASIKNNICAPSLKKISRHGIITAKTEKNFANKKAQELGVKMQDIEQYVSFLSGGNKQKVSVAKWIGFDADVLIFDCPTRGIDIGVKAAIYELMMKLKAQGKAIMMISEEMMEVIGMSDRILILKEGEITGSFCREDKVTEGKMINYMI